MIDPYSKKTVTGGERIRQALRVRLVGAARGDEGQALIMVLIAILLVSLVVPVLVSQLSGEAAYAGENVNFEAALAAAEAGAQQYRNFLDVDSNYYRYTGTGCPGGGCNDDGDQALDPNGWDSVAGSSPPEAFHYIPNTTYLAGSIASPEVLLTVTGRAGGPNHYVYRTIQQTMQSDGLLSNAYYSSYEVLDPAQNTAAVYDPSTLSTPNQVMNPGATNAAAAPCQCGVAAAAPSFPSLWSALCGYETYQPNLYIDSLSPGISNPYVPGQVYSASYPYYGPYRGSDPQTGAGLTISVPVNTTTNETVTDPCGTIFEFLSSENFDGPVYTGDQLWVCGSPTFSQGLVSAVPKNFKYLYPQWPAQGGNTTGTLGWIDDNAAQWDGTGGCGSSKPKFTPTPLNPSGLEQGGNESLPNTNTLLPKLAATSGCLYTGPTMIEFVPGGNTFKVWSPLSGTIGGAGSTACGGPFTPAAPTSTGQISATTGLVIFDQNVPSGTTIPDASTFWGNGLPTGATCLNPWKPWAPQTSQVTSGASTYGVCPQASEGDLVVEGELTGQVTMDAQDNVIVSRDLSYACAVTTDKGGVEAQDVAGYQLPSKCYPSEPDVLGIVAGGDIVISHPDPGLGGVVGVTVTKGSTTLTSSSGFPANVAKYVGNGWTVAVTGASYEGAGLDDSGIPAGTTVTSVSGTTLKMSNKASWSGTATVVFTDAQYQDADTEPYEWSPSSTTDPWCPDDGTESSPNLTNVEPNCDIANPTIDGALIALTGSLADEDYDSGMNDYTSYCDPTGGGQSTQCGVYVVGADIGEYRGPFGIDGYQYCSGDCGYYKEFTFDKRLFYLSPPNLNQIADVLWVPISFASCGSVNDGPYTNSSGSPNVCPGVSF